MGPREHAFKAGGKLGFQTNIDDFLQVYNSVASRRADTLLSNPGSIVVRKTGMGSEVYDVISNKKSNIALKTVVEQEKTEDYTFDFEKRDDLKKAQM